MVGVTLFFAGLVIFFPTRREQKTSIFNGVFPRLCCLISRATSFVRRKIPSRERRYPEIRMNRGVIVRLAIFIATIVLLVALIGWTAHSSWRRIKTSHDNLEWQSFQIANHVQQNILSL